MFYNIFKKVDKEYTIVSKLRMVIYSYLLSLLFIVLFVFLIMIVDYLVVNLFDFPSILNLFKEHKEQIDTYNPFRVVLLAPIIEEVLFRLILKYSKLNFIIFFSFLSFYIINGTFLNIDYKSYELYVYIVFLLISIKYINKYDEYIKNIIKKNNKAIIIFSIITFGLIHIFNIKPLYWELALIYPIYVLPQISMGYFITNLRLKFGFIWGVALHILINFMGTIIF